MRVLVADSDKRVRKALSMLLNLEPNLSVVGESTDAPTLLAHAQTLGPDLVLLDADLPGGSTAALVGGLREAARCRVIVLSRRPESEQVAQAVGADAFVSKTDPADSLLETLHRVIYPQERDSATALA